MYSLSTVKLSKIRRAHQGFTLVELLVSMAILSMLLLVITKILGDTQKAWTMTNTRISQFRETRRAFDVIKGNLSQATLNTYLRFRYDNRDNPYSPFRANGDEITNAAPVNYTRFSELQFLCGPMENLFDSSSTMTIANPSGHGIFFQAPLGQSSEYVNTPTAFNPKGYYVEFGGDTAFKPDFLSIRVEDKYRWRLMEYSPPIEFNTIFDEDSITTQGDWINDLEFFSRPIADNVIALYFSPRRPSNDDLTKDPREIAPRYFYNTSATGNADRYPANQFGQLPPQVDIVMVVLDEVSAARLQDQYGESPPFELAYFDGAASNDEFRKSLEELETFLVNQPSKLNFRVFTGTVPLRNSKWGSTPVE